MDELAGAVDITRSAVREHLTGMESSGYVQQTSSKSGGRPRFSIRLPKAASICSEARSWSRVMFESLRKKIGA